MKPFSIICKSCAVRLKVTKASAVDQLLACPKCGTMIKVVPPKGWVRPDVSASSNNLKTTSPATSKPKSNLSSIPPGAAAADGKDSFDFDDIDQLLSKPDQIESVGNSTAANEVPPVTDSRSNKEEQTNQLASVPTDDPRKKSRVEPAASLENADSDSAASPSPDSEPMLPNDQWQSEKSKRQKRLVRILGSILGCIFFAGFVLALINAGREKPPMPVLEKKVADNDAQLPHASPVDPVDATTSRTETTIPDPPESAVSNLDPDSQSKTQSETEGSTTHNTQPELPSTTLPEQANQPPDSTSQKPPPLPSPFRNAQGDPDTKTPDTTTPEPARNKQAGVGMVAKIENQMGDLAGLLEKSGASLSDLRDVAFEASGQSFAGIPKYVIEKPGPLKSDLERLKLNVGGILFKDSPLPVVARELTSISGVPITLDARSLDAAGKDVNQLITHTIKDADLDSAINRILVPLGMTKKPDSVGLKFTTPNSQDFKPASYSIAEFNTLDEQAKERFLSYVQVMIQPQIWVRSQNPATLELANDNIAANCPAETQAQIKRLIAKLRAAHTLVGDPTNQAATVQTLTRSGSIIAKLEAPIEIQQSLRTPIGIYFTKLQIKSGVTVLVDWDSVSKEGWTPRTVIPGSINEPTTGDLIKKLAQSMNLAIVAVDQNTLVLTTTGQAAITRDIEVYPVAKLLAGKFDENQLKEAFETTLGYQLRTEKYVYDANCQCFIVAASQSKQRQVEALLKRLEGI